MSATGHEGGSDPDASYPPEPWDLAGSGGVTAWWVPVHDLPALPPGTTPLRLGRPARAGALVLGAWVDYSPAGLLSYHELLAGVVVRHGRGLALSVTDIWVDSEVSLRGGRALWGIPKDLARFEGSRATTSDGPVAGATWRPVPTLDRLPALPLPVLPGRVVQRRGGTTASSPVRASGRVRPVRARWDLPADGPLAWMGRARQLASVRVEDFSMRFGSAG